jgi:Rrf2 family transcriptional regulator, cysteine metabolism repressor
MQLSQKCQYALRALFELAKRQGEGPLTVAQIAESQAIPARFLELIVQELRVQGWIRSRRGSNGGYTLVAAPASVTVASIIRLIDGSLAPVHCVAGKDERSCSLRGRCAFMRMWQRAQEAVERVYETTTLQDLIDEEQQCGAGRGAEALLIGQFM